MNLNCSQDANTTVNITGGLGQLKDQLVTIEPPNEVRDIKHNENVFNNKDDDYQQNSDEDWNQDEHETPEESQNEDELFEEEVKEEEQHEDHSQEEYDAEEEEELEDDQIFSEEDKEYGFESFRYNQNR